MNDSTESDLTRAARRLADGERIDWEALAGEPSLTPQEREALFLLEQVRLVDASEPLEDGFELRGELGHGGSGRVFRAFDRSLRREVALKVVASASERQRTNFVAEARLLASVDHPGIVRVHSIHEHQGEVRMALELVEGQTLERIVLADGPLSCAETARVGVELCRALAVLHARGIVHRDLKPANVMRGAEGRVVLLDFGIARSVDVPAPGAGTPRFMAPEQFEGEPTGPWTDLWSLGALLYWLTSSRYPFGGTSWETLRESVGRGRPSPLEARAMKPHFGALLLRALERDPEKRLRSAQEFERALLPFLEPPPSVGAPHMRVALSFAAAGFAAGALWLLQGEPVTAFALEAEFFACRQGQDVRLRSGDTIAEDELLVLEASAPCEFYLYVLDEDDAGEMHVLFPAPGYEPGNPLPGGSAQRLPGHFGGMEQFWAVTSHGGGAENLLVVAAQEPLAELAEFMARISPVRPGESPAYPALPSRTRTALLRGIGATRSEARATAAADAEHKPGELEAFVARLEPAPERAVRFVRLLHAP